MEKNTKLIDAVVETAKETTGRKKLTCAAAFGLAERFGVEKRKIGQICNENNIRITDCQLGCFK